MDFTLAFTTNQRQPVGSRPGPGFRAPVAPGATGAGALPVNGLVVRKLPDAVHDLDVR